MTNPYDTATALFVVAVWVLALASVTHLAVRDVITDPLREWLLNRRDGVETKAYYFATCPWCVSMWLSFGSVWLVFLLTDLTWWLYAPLALAGRYLVGLMATNLEGDDDAEYEER